MKKTLLMLALVAAGLAPLAGAEALNGQAMPPGIAWKQGDVDAAFAQAQKENKPLFLYWGAVWCPPCNQVKGTIFNRQDFIAATREFIPVYLDGDSEDAQKLGERFKVRGYPTMILFNPAGAEITRLPGEVDPQRYLRTLQLGLVSAKPVKALLSDALAGKDLSDADWQLLAGYAWDVDQGQVAPEAELSAALVKLAARVPAQPAATATRLQLKTLSIVASDKNAPAIDKAVAARRVAAVLADPVATRANADILINSAADIVSFLGQDRSAWNGALARLEKDETLSRADRLSALAARLALAKQVNKDHPPQVLLDDIRAQVAAAQKAVVNPFERHSVVTAGAEMMSDAGLLDESDRLLLPELKTSHAPYYDMLILAGNAKERGDKPGALEWYAKAWQASEGPATRLQWGASYVGAAIELAPQDEKRIEQTASAVFAEAGKTQGAFYERSGRSLSKVVNRLKGWNKDGAHQQAVGRLLTQLGGVCKQLPEQDPQRALCDKLAAGNKG